LPGVNQRGVDMQSSLPARPSTGGFAQVAEWADESTLLVRMRGALDFYSVREAERLLLGLLERRPTRVVIDVSGALVDSSGIGLIIHVAQRVRMERGDFRLVCKEQLGRILRFHQLDELIQTDDSIEAALERLARSRSARRRTRPREDRGRREAAAPAARRPAPGSRTPGSPARVDTASRRRSPAS
jgi:anti-anti-sigma factor